jgi:hypothetical protein
MFDMSRTFIHMLLGVLLWVVFGYYWYLVMRQPVTEQTRHALLTVGCIVAVVTLFDLFWIGHNVRISRRTRRLTRPAATDAPLADFLGRTFVAQSEEQLRRARYIEVHVVQIEDNDQAAGHKLFRVTDHIPGPE